ncbi:MAG: PDZ domain-containing protein [Gammaproteobacteria bacterium]|nr:PDZ domain-containing protein [Gammaproteobacteria bacterium]
MKMWKLIGPIAATLLFAGQAVAQSEEQQAEREVQVREAEYAERLRDAEERMEQAARQIAEISRERMPNMANIQRRFAFSKKPMIGITIEGDDESGPVEGVEVGGVTPGGAADDAGIRAGDIITSVNDESMSAESSSKADKKLFEFMHGVEEGDELVIEYLRNGNAGSVALKPRVSESQVFAWSSDAPAGMHIEKIPGMPEVIREFRFDGRFPWADSGLGSMELVELNEGLGKYFGTDAGLLVVSAPQSDAFELQDGDVIQSIDGRVPKDVRQALRILGTYEAGDSLKLGIMRDKRKRTLEIEIPESDQQGMLLEPGAPLPVLPARAPAPPVAPVVDLLT